MGLIPTTPSEEVVSITATKTLDNFQILNVQIHLNPQDQSAILSVLWCSGWVEDGTYHVGATTHSNISGANLEAAMASEVEGTLYNVIKTAVWGLLQAESIVPAGTID